MVAQTVTERCIRSNHSFRRQETPGRGAGSGPRFSTADALDGLVLLDLRRTDSIALERYMGKEGLERFRRYHNLLPQSHPATHSCKANQVSQNLTSHQAEREGQVGFSMCRSLPRIFWLRSVLRPTQLFSGSGTNRYPTPRTVSRCLGLAGSSSM